MSARSHLIFWSLTLLAFFLLVWVLRDILAPFVVGGAVAYLLGPVVRRMMQAGLPRGVAAGLLLFGFILVVGGLIALIAPLAYREALQLIEGMPRYAAWIQQHIIPTIVAIQERFNIGDTTAVQDGLKNNIGQVFKISGDIASGVIGGTQNIIGAATFTVLTMIAAFFMMQDWLRMTQWIDDMVPRHHYNTIHGILAAIDRKIAGFVRGQLMIAFMLGMIFAVGLTLAGLKFGFLIGLLAGVLSIVPMLGSLIGLILAVAVAWLQAGNLAYVGGIALFFIVVQLLESNVITPRIMGESVGLHPLWIVFSLFAGGSLMGITGMLLAVPVAASIGVLCAVAVTAYKSSPYYGAAS
jgi:predicted PurR-regulated permease PerM